MLIKKYDFNKNCVNFVNYVNKTFINKIFHGHKKSFVIIVSIISDLSAFGAAIEEKWSKSCRWTFNFSTFNSLSVNKCPSPTEKFKPIKKY